MTQPETDRSRMLSGFSGSLSESEKNSFMLVIRRTSLRKTRKSYAVQSLHLMFNVHLFENGCAVVGDGDVVVGGHHHLVQAFRAQRRFERVGDGARRLNVAL